MRALVVVLAVVGATSGCGSDPSGDGAGTDATITVVAATSLTEAFERIAARFETANPGVEVALSFGASSTNSAQVLAGAPADVVASADEATMARLVDEGVVGQPVAFAGNGLVVVTKPGNPEGIDELSDLADAGVISLCGDEVPCGRYAEQVLAGAGVEVPESSITRGQNVGATLTAVTQGDAVAGIVYLTDAAAVGGDVATVEIPADVQVAATYPIAVLDETGAPGTAQAFVDFVLGTEGQQVLRDLGFAEPS